MLDAFFHACYNEAIKNLSTERSHIMIIKEKVRGIHPRLIYSKKEIDAFKEALGSSDKRKAFVADIREKCEKMLDEALLTEEYANAAMTQHGNFYEIGAQLEKFAPNFSFMYQLGEDKEGKYVAKMKEAMLHYAKFEAWTGPSNKFRKVPWQSDLSTTRILYAYAVAYDCMYDAFTEEERAIFRNAMMKLAINPLLSDWMYDGVRVHALDSMGHNWWAVCTGLAGLGLCAIYDEVEGSIAILQDVIKSLRMFCEYDSEPLLNKVANFDDKGMFYESCNYFNYGAGELCRFLFSWRNCFEDNGDSDIPVLKKLPDAFMALSYPTSKDDRNYFVNFGDSALKGKFPMLPIYLLLLGYGGENFKRFYCRQRTEYNIFDMLYPDILDGWDGSAPTYPKTDLYPGTGLAFLRSDDGNEKGEDATMLAVRCGFSWNHAHDDAGSFILFHKGENLLCDCGTTGYGNADYKSFYCAAEAHNIVTIDGEAQWHENNYRGNKFVGTLPHFVEDGKLAYLLADATGPVANLCLRNHRSFLRLDENLFVVIDDLYTYVPSEFTFLLHYNGEMTDENNRITVKTGKAKATIATVSPVTYTLERRSYKEIEYAALKTNEKSRLFNMINVISLGDDELTVTPIDGADWYGCEITCRGNIYRLCYNFEADGRNMHINSNNILAGWGTDAYILCDVNNGERVMMIYGSYLRKDGESKFESLKKEFKIF